MRICPFLHLFIVVEKQVALPYTGCCFRALLGVKNPIIPLSLCEMSFAARLPSAAAVGSPPGGCCHCEASKRFFHCVAVQGVGRGNLPLGNIKLIYAPASALV